MCWTKSQTWYKSDKKLKKTKGVTVGALCKVLGFPRWVYFSTGRAGFRSRRDVSEDRAANRANTHTHGRAHAHILTCIWDVQPCTKKKKKHKCVPTHTHTHTCLREGSTGGSIGIQGRVPPISRLSQHSRSLHCPWGRRIMHKTKHVGRNN